MTEPTVTIKLERGSITVSAPPDKVLALGMIEFAKHLLMEQTQDERKSRKIAVPTIFPINQV